MIKKIYIAIIVILTSFFLVGCKSQQLVDVTKLENLTTEEYDQFKINFGLKLTENKIKKFYGDLKIKDNFEAPDVLDNQTKVNYDFNEYLEFFIKKENVVEDYGLFYISSIFYQKKKNDKDSHNSKFVSKVEGVIKNNKTYLKANKSGQTISLENGKIKMIDIKKDDVRGRLENGKEFFNLFHSMYQELSDLISDQKNLKKDKKGLIYITKELKFVNTFNRDLEYDLQASFVFDKKGNVLSFQAFEKNKVTWEMKVEKNKEFSFKTEIFSGNESNFPVSENYTKYLLEIK